MHHRSVSSTLLSAHKRLLQNAWCVAAGLGGVGEDAGGSLFSRLVEAWRSVKVEGTLHVLCDDNGEERYHSLYMKAAAEAAGVRCTFVVGCAPLESWSFDADGRVVDADGTRVLNVWKTWSWQTVVDLTRESDTEYYARYINGGDTSPAPGPPPGVPGARRPR